MTQFTLRTCYFDFRKARVKSSLDGVTWSPCDKFELCYTLKHIEYYKYLYAYETFTYKGCKESLLNEFQKYNFPNVHIIK